MPKNSPPPPRPPGTPDDVVITWHPVAPTPPGKADLGVPLLQPLDVSGTPRHRLVVIGDSLSHGFKNYAISDTKHSWPAIVAYELGCLADFRRPVYKGPEACKGLPLNLYELVSQMEKAAKGKPHIVGWAFMLGSLWWTMARVKWYWDWGPGSRTPSNGPFNHNLAIYGWDIRDSLSKDVGWCQDSIRGLRGRQRPPHQRPRRKKGNAFTSVLHWLGNAALGLLFPQVTHPNERAARLVLWGDGNRSNTQITAAKALGDEGTVDGVGGDGIETLVVALGANNVLKTVVLLKLAWSEEGKFKDLHAKDLYTIWRPEHFKAELEELVARVREIRARHVIWTSVPHVTIVPIARGVGEKPYYSRYFSRYTYVLTPDAEFDGNVNATMSAAEARLVDSVIDGYNEMIKDAVLQGRKAGKDWFYFDGCGLLDSMAYRRYFEDDRARPAGWKPYSFPKEFNALRSFPDTRFITSDHKGTMTGGLIGLDGVHPTALGYGIVAQEIIKVMQLAGVAFKTPEGSPRRGRVRINWNRLIAAEPLVQQPLQTLSEDLGIAGWLLEGLDLGKLLIT